MSDNFQGDPLGRRLARNRAARLSEAGNVARLLAELVKRAGYDSSECDALIAGLQRDEQIELLRSYGRIEPRNRFKRHAPQPLLEDRPINNLYVDENGKSSAEPTGSPDIFTLGAIAIDDVQVAAYREGADRLKETHFGTSELTFHEPYMRRRSGPLYYFGGDESKQVAFDAAVNELIASVEFTVFGVAIRKRLFDSEFVKTGVDPYLPTDVYDLAIVLLLERYVDYLATRDVQHMGRVTFESIGPLEDAQHQHGYARVLIDGSQWVPDSAFRNWLETGLRFTTKRGTDPTELADMFSRDLFEWAVSGCQSVPERWDTFSRRIYRRGDGQMGKFGVKVFPSSDIQDRIDAHRTRYGASP